MIFGFGRWAWRLRWPSYNLHPPPWAVRGGLKGRSLAAPRETTARTSPTPAGVAPPAKGAGLELHGQ
jgi:hypothetical protein